MKFYFLCWFSIWLLFNCHLTRSEDPNVIAHNFSKKVKSHFWRAFKNIPFNYVLIAPSGGKRDWNTNKSLYFLDLNNDSETNFQTKLTDFGGSSGSVQE